MTTKKELLDLNEKLQTILCEIRVKIEEALKETELVCPLPDEAEETQEVETPSSEEAKEGNISKTEKDNNKEEA